MVERRERRPLILQPMALVTTNLMPLLSTTRLLIESTMMLDRMMRHLGTVTAGLPTERKKSVTRGVMMKPATARPIPRRNDTRSATVSIGVIVTGRVETANRDDTRGIATIDTMGTIDIVATAVESDTEVETGIKVGTIDGTTITVTGTTITVTANRIARRIPIPVPDAQREVAPGRGEIQSHARVETTLLDTEAEIGKLLS